MLTLRVRQALAVIAGCALTAGMVWMGFWQLRVYYAQGAEVAAARAAEAPRALTAVAKPGEKITDGYGRTVVIEGSYLPETQLLVPAPAGTRVLAGVRQADGSVIAVVRGQVPESATDPPPTGLVRRTGILMPSEEAGPASASGKLTSVRVPQLAQRWPGPLIDGFVTLDAASAGAEHLNPATVTLPEAPGRLRNGAYAWQWFVFAAFTLIMSGRIARELGRASQGPRQA